MVHCERSSPVLSEPRLLCPSPMRIRLLSGTRCTRSVAVTRNADRRKLYQTRISDSAQNHWLCGHQRTTQPPPVPKGRTSQYVETARRCALQGASRVGRSSRRTSRPAVTDYESSRQFAHRYSLYNVARPRLRRAPPCANASAEESAEALAKANGDDRARTGNPQLAKLVLSQLSYVPDPISAAITSASGAASCR